MVFVSIVQFVGTRSSYGSAPIFLVTLDDAVKLFDELGHVLLFPFRCCFKNMVGDFTVIVGEIKYSYNGGRKVPLLYVTTQVCTSLKRTTMAILMVLNT